MRRTWGSYIPGTSEDENGIPDLPPVPTNLAEAIAAFVNVTVENSRLLHEKAQSNQNQMQGNRGRHHNRCRRNMVGSPSRGMPMMVDCR